MIWKDDDNVADAAAKIPYATIIPKILLFIISPDLNNLISRI
jgi:hypothetical protein